MRKNTKAAKTNDKINKPLPDVRKPPQPLEVRPSAAIDEPSRKPQIESHTHSPKKAFIDTDALPLSYNTTRLTLIARDPCWIHAYWEISSASIEEVKRKIGSDFDRSSYTLRMYDVTYVDFNGANANSWFDIYFHHTANNWYINLWRDDATYCGEIGVRTPDGRFFSIARSNFVTMPRAHPSGRNDLMWMEVKGESAPSPFVIVETQKPKKELPSEARTSKRKIFLSEKDIGVYYQKLFPLLRLVTRRAKKSSDIHIGRELIGARLKDGIILDDIIIRGLTKHQFIKRILLGSSEELVLREEEIGGASEFKGASERAEKKRKFFFEIGTELIVYGRTEPDAEVWLGDKKIKLREDGTFTLRFALPDGKIPLDFVAQSGDKVDERSISTSVERAKTKHIS